MSEPSTPPPIPPLIPHVSYGHRTPDPAWLFFGAARQALKFLAGQLVLQRPSLMFVVPAYTCDTVVQALDEVGANITFVDIDEQLDFDLHALERTLQSTDRRSVVMLATPLFGAPVRDYKTLFPECTVIEDRAQCSHDPASTADYQLLSFGPGKRVSGMGGGALIGAQTMRERYLALPTDDDVLKRQCLSRAGDWLLGAGWALLGARLSRRHAHAALTALSQTIEPRAMDSRGARWIAHSLFTLPIDDRIAIADRYGKEIPVSRRFSLPRGRSYLRYPVRGRLDGPGVASGDMYERVVARAEETQRMPMPGARALVQASLLPTHQRVTDRHVAWYLAQCAEQVHTP